MRDLSLHFCFIVRFPWLVSGQLQVMDMLNSLYFLSKPSHATTWYHGKHLWEYFSQLVELTLGILQAGRADVRRSVCMRWLLFAISLVKCLPPALLLFVHPKTRKEMVSSFIIWGEKIIINWGIVPASESLNWHFSREALFCFLLGFWNSSCWNFTENVVFICVIWALTNRDICFL